VEALEGQEDQKAWDQKDLEGDHKYLSSQWHQQETSKLWDNYHKYSWEIGIKQITSSRKLKDTYVSIKT
jgi:hypothetical protein